MTEGLTNRIPERQVALVVGAGGPTGAPFIYAALDALERATGWVPGSSQQIVGTSAGAFVASSFDELSITPMGSNAALTGLANGHEYAPRIRHRIAAIARLLAGRVVAVVAPKSRPSADYRVHAPPYHPGAQVVTVEHRTGRRRLHELRNSAKVEAIVRASSAIPGRNAPVDLDGRLHVDGAVHSATNVDLADHQRLDLLVVIAPMIPASGGSLVSRFHRAQLRSELAPWLVPGRDAVVIMPDEPAHADRRDRERFSAAGGAVVRKLTY